MSDPDWLVEAFGVWDEAEWRNPADVAGSKAEYGGAEADDSPKERGVVLPLLVSLSEKNRRSEGAPVRIIGL